MFMIGAWWLKVKQSCVQRDHGAAAVLRKELAGAYIANLVVLKAAKILLLIGDSPARMQQISGGRSYVPKHPATPNATQLRT